MNKIVENAYKFIVENKTKEIENFSIELKKGMKKFFNFSCYTDVYPGLVTKVINDKTIQVEELEIMANPLNENKDFGHQDWFLFRATENRVVKIFTKRKNGRWCEKGLPMNKGFVGTFSDKPFYFFDWTF